jgi:AraC-like DNA-binding protein
MMDAGTVSALDMQPLLEQVEVLACREADGSGYRSIRQLGFISCNSSVLIRHVPFYEPCLILVLSGYKQIRDNPGCVEAGVGRLLAVPASSGYDIVNEPDANSGLYRALVIPFGIHLLQQLRQWHDLAGSAGDAGVMVFDMDATLESSLRHYLQCPEDERLISHRLTEILLLLVTRNPSLLHYEIPADVYSRQVRSILASDLVHEWSIAEVCERMATSETTLRRKLRGEKTGFRELLYELRLSNALMLLVQTRQPVYRVAYACGYQSVSRFSSNFRKRFGVSPSEVRGNKNESEQILAVSEHL